LCLSKRRNVGRSLVKFHVRNEKFHRLQQIFCLETCYNKISITVAQNLGQQTQLIRHN